MPLEAYAGAAIPLPRETRSIAVPAPAAPATARQATVAYVGLTLGLAVAVFVRFYRLGDIPLPLLAAEDAFRKAALMVMDRGWIGLWSEATAGQPTGLAYWMAGWVSLSGDTLLVLRLLPAAVGLATLGMFFLFCRSLFGERAGALGTLLMAYSVWHLTYSRVALPVGLLPLVMLITAFLLFMSFGEKRDARRRERLLWLAGIAFGSGVYYHNAFFIFAVAVFAFWAREYLSAELSPETLRRMSRGFLVPALLVAAPYLGYLIINLGGVVDRVQSVAVTREPGFRQQNGVTEQTRFVLARAATTARVLLWRRGGGDGERDEQSRRLLDPVTAVLAVAGLAVGVWNWRERGHFFLLSLTAAAVLSVSLTLDSGMYGRLIVALPAVFAYAGFSLHWLLVWMRGRAPQLAAYGVVALLVALACAHNLSSYYRHPGGQNEALWATTGQNGVAAAPDLAALLPR